VADPINQKNAINSAIFMLKFNREFSQEENKAMVGIAEVLKDDLPKVNELKKFSLNIDATKQKQSGEFETSGLSLQSFRPDGTPAWELQVMHDAVVATCRTYTSWTKEKETAIKYLKTVLHVLEHSGSDNLISGVTLQITDRFIEPNFVSYDLGEVFNNESPYLTKNALTQGALWHVFQGWFDDMNGAFDGRCLNILNISTNLTKDHTSNIEYSIQDQISEPQQAAVFNQEADYLNSIFDNLHEKNKIVIKELLCNKQLKAIGLC